MRKAVFAFSLPLLVAGSLSGAGQANAQESYEVIITNLTRGQQFTPVLVASHKPSLSLFKEGSAASPELAILAESGNTAPLAALLQNNTKSVKAVEASSGLLDPGKSVKVIVDAGQSFNRISLAGDVNPYQRWFYCFE